MCCWKKLSVLWCSSSVWKKGLCKDGTLQPALVTVAWHPLAGTAPAHAFPTCAAVALQPGKVDTLLAVPEARRGYLSICAFGSVLLAVCLGRPFVCSPFKRASQVY